MDLIWTLKVIPAAVIGLTFHEFSHAYSAFKLGDNTAKEQGRVTLNPLKHIDWIGFFLIIIAGFGWAKPVTFNPENLKNKNRDEIIISLAGPLSNLVLAILFFIIARILYFTEFFNSNSTGVEVINLLIIWGVVNCGLFIFNLIPIPPLDGSHLYMTFLHDINPKLMMNIYRYGTWALLIIILAQNKLNIEILPINSLIENITRFFLNLLSF